MHHDYEIAPATQTQLNSYLQNGENYNEYGNNQQASGYRKCRNCGER